MEEQFCFQLGASFPADNTLHSVVLNGCIDSLPYQIYRQMI